MKDAIPKPGNRLAIGTAQFGIDYGVTNKSGRVPPLEVARIFERAGESGVSVLDTASAYGDAEKVLGDTGTGNFRIVTKLPPVPEGVEIHSQWVTDQVSKSASRLRRQDVYALLVHNPGDLRGASGQELIKGLIDSKEAGHIQKVGVSIYNPEDLEWISDLLNLDIVQAPMSVFDRRMVHSGWLDRLSKSGVEIHVRSVYLQGTLLAGVENLPDLLRPWAGKFMEFETWAESEDLSLLEAALLYPLSFSDVDKVVLGVVSVEQLDQAVEASQKAQPEFPDFATNDLQLINPVNWTR